MRFDALEIPEMEEHKPPRRYWSEREIAALRKYYRTTRGRSLVAYFAKHFPPGRSLNALQNKAQMMGFSRRKGEGD